MVSSGSSPLPHQCFFLIGVCGRTSMRFGAVIFDRRGRNPVRAKLIKKGLHDVGAHGAVTLRSDGENALADLLHAVARERQAVTLVERGPRGDSQANGRTERSIRVAEEIVRVLRADLYSLWSGDRPRIRCL